MKIGFDHIGVSVGAVIIDEAGKYFLAKRGKGARDSDIGWFGLEELRQLELSRVTRLNVDDLLRQGF